MHKRHGSQMMIYSVSNDTQFGARAWGGGGEEGQIDVGGPLCRGVVGGLERVNQQPCVWGRVMVC